MRTELKEKSIDGEGCNHASLSPEPSLPQGNAVPAPQIPPCGMLLKQSGPQAQRSSFLSPQPSAPCLHDLFSDVCTGLLSLGQGVRFKANGWSMYPTIRDGEMISVESVLPSQIRHGDIILYRSSRGITAHRVIRVQMETNSAVVPHGPSFLFTTRGDSIRADDPPLMSDQILGKVCSVERKGRTVALYGNRAIIIQEAHLFLFTLKRCVIQALSRMKGLFLRYKASFKTNTMDT